MTAPWIAFVLFTVLTIAFAAVLLWRLIPRAQPARPDITLHSQALANVVAQGPTAESMKTMAEAVSTILTAIGDFGTKLDTFGPAALLGVFTLIFALFALASAWMAH